MTIARQLGLMPPEGSKAEQGMKGAFNAKTRAAKRLGGKLEPVADGVWLLRGGFPIKTMNVYFVKDGDGVLLFDTGIRQMTNALARPAPSSAGSRASCSGTPTSTTAAARRGSACPSTATRPTRPTPRATAASTTSTSASSTRSASCCSRRS